MSHATEEFDDVVCERETEDANPWVWVVGFERVKPPRGTTER